MPIDLTDTTTGKIAEALTDARARLGGAALGMGLTLVVETDEAAQDDAMRGANAAGRDHPPPECRVAAGCGDPRGRGQPGRDRAAAHVRAARPARRLRDRAAAG